MAPSSEQYAQLAALFTTEPDPEVKSSIELLLPAHLPVQGGLWLVPYAGREAADGLAILLRMHEDTIDLAAIGQGDFDLSGCASLDSVMECVGTEVAHWIVQPPSDCCTAMQIASRFCLAQIKPQLWERIAFSKV